jgi:hypothetical protein
MFFPYNSCLAGNELVAKLTKNTTSGQNKIENFFHPCLLLPFPDQHELSKSLFNVRHREPGEVLPPNDADMPVGRIKRLLKSNSLTALANINFGWRKETSV